MIQRILFSALFAAAITASAMAAPVTIVDTTPTSATRNGVVAPGEYVGYSTGINGGFGNVIGSQSKLHVDSSADGELHFALERGGGPLVDDVVIYIDSVAGGFGDTTAMADMADTLRRAIAANSEGFGVFPNSELFFAPTFAADYAIAFNESFGGLWKLAAGGDNSLEFLKSVSLNPMTAFAAGHEMELLLADIGLTSGDSFKYVATYMNADDFGMYRSNEFHGVSPATPLPVDDANGNPGRKNVVLTAGDFNTFQSYAVTPEPSCLGLAGVASIALFGIRRQFR